MRETVSLEVLTPAALCDLIFAVFGTTWPPGRACLLLGLLHASDEGTLTFSIDGMRHNITYNSNNNVLTLDSEPRT